MPRKIGIGLGLYGKSVLYLSKQAQLLGAKSAAEWLMRPLFPPRKSYIISNMLGGNRVSFRDLILFILNACDV